MNAESMQIKEMLGPLGLMVLFAAPIQKALKSITTYLALMRVKPLVPVTKIRSCLNWSENFSLHLNFSKVNAVNYTFFTLSQFLCWQLRRVCSSDVDEMCTCIFLLKKSDVRVKLSAWRLLAVKDKWKQDTVHTAAKPGWAY